MAQLHPGPLPVRISLSHGIQLKAALSASFMHTEVAQTVAACSTCSSNLQKTSLPLTCHFLQASSTSPISSGTCQQQTKQAPRLLNTSPICLHATELPLCMPRSIAVRPYQFHVSTHAASTTPRQLQPFPIHPLLSFTPRTHIPSYRAVLIVRYSSSSFHPYMPLSSAERAHAAFPPAGLSLLFIPCMDKLPAHTFLTRL